MSEMQFDPSTFRMDVLMKKAPRRGEGKRILWFLLCSVPLNIAVSMVMTLLNSIVTAFLNSDGFASSWLGERFTVGEFVMLWSYVSSFVWLLEKIGAALLNRCLTFRSRAGWYWSIPAMIGVYLTFQVLNTAVAGAIWEPLAELMAAENGMSFGAAISLISLSYSGVSAVLWLVVSYVFQRFVLYRRTLDTNGLAQR